MTLVSGFPSDQAFAQAALVTWCPLDMVLRARNARQCFASMRKASVTRSHQTLASSNTAPQSHSNECIRLRFAPSPTGFMHLGSLRTALFNHLLARKNKGKWILRIEDTDQSRLVEGAVESLLNNLKWLGLLYDEGPERPAQVGDKGPYTQSERKKIYDRYLCKLVQQGKAYPCFCTTDRLAILRSQNGKKGHRSVYDKNCANLKPDEVAIKKASGLPCVYRFRSTATEMTQDDLVYDSIQYKDMPMEDFVIQKSDGLPTYHFASVVDDHEMGVTHVLRGEEWLASTPKHLMLYTALGLAPPQYAHLPIIVTKSGAKLSKRDGSAHLETFKTKGYEPEALLNFVALLGWSPRSSASHGAETKFGQRQNDVLSMSEMIEHFSLEAVNKNRPTISLAKLDSLNKSHIQRKLEDGESEVRLEFIRRVQDGLMRLLPDNLQATDIELVSRVLMIMKDRIYIVADVPLQTAYFFERPDVTAYAGAAPKIEAWGSNSQSDTYAQVVSEAMDRLKSLGASAWIQAEEDVKEIVDILNDMENQTRTIRQIMQPLRHALTASTTGPGVAIIVGFLGKTECLKRLERALQWHRTGAL